MSAFIVSDFHINCLVNWAAARNDIDRVSYRWHGQRIDWHGHEERIAQVLHAENVRSFQYRYRMPASPQGFSYRLELRGMQLAAIQVIRAAHCLDYQSCECDDWEATEAFATLQGLVDAAVRSLPEYGRAAWELLDDDSRMNSTAASIGTTKSAMDECIKNGKGGML